MSSVVATIYIPRILSYFTEEQIARVFINYDIGNVARVDFNAIGKKPGFKEEEESNVRCAFVHINHFYNSVVSNEIQKALEEEKEYRLQLNNNSYWILLKTKTPVKATNMNIHQIVDNCRYLEGIVEQQQKQIEEMSTLIKCLQGEVYQLIGGLYNQTTQEGSIEIHVAHLYNDKIDVENGKANTSNWSIWPTTRQGDYLEKQVEKIMAKLNISDCDSASAENYYSHDHSHNHSHDDCGCGCECDRYDSDANNLLGQKRSYESDSDSDNDDNSNSESERVKNSSTLCGNE